MKTFKSLFADAVQHKEILYQLYFIGAFLQANFNNRVFVKLDSRYADYFPEYSNYFGRALRLLKSMYGMTNSGKLFFDVLHSGYLRYDSFNINVICLYIIVMHQMEQKLLLYIMLMTVYIDILLEIL